MNSLLQSFQTHLAGTSQFSYLIAFLAGLMASFTPCVYPLIPILVGYIAGRDEHKKSKAFFLSLFYVIGMSLTYCILGAIAALSGKLFGEVQNNPWVYLFIANIIFLMGFSMLGVFSLPIPNFIKNNKQNKKRNGFWGSFLLGASSGLIAAPCTTAVLGVLLTYVATKQNVFFGISLLFVFSFGLGAILLIAGTFTGFLLSLPKPGKWMDVVSKVFGWAMVILAEYLFIKAGMLFI